MVPENAQQGLADKKRSDISDSGIFDTLTVSPDTRDESPHPARVCGTIADWVGKSLGKYDITGVLGEGGMGLVLKARDRMIERDVAIKVLAGHLASDALALDRFLAEAKAAGKFNHPNVTAIYEIGQENGIYYLVLEFVPGGSLSQRLQRPEPISLVEATQVLIDACKGVGAAHAAGLIHRDIKPANFLRAVDGSTKVADFGIAKAVAENGKQATQSGQLVGTPWYMSPEQCEGKPLDHRTDVYSLGATYYTLLTGKTPYHETRGAIQVMFMHCDGPVPDPRAINAAIPDDCCRIVAQAMAKAPVDRYQSTGEMLADLRAVLQGFSGQVPACGNSNLEVRSSNLELRPSVKGQSAKAKDRSSKIQGRRSKIQGRRSKIEGRRSKIAAGLIAPAVILFVVLGTLPIFLWRAGWLGRAAPGTRSGPGAPVVVPPVGDPIKVGVLQSLSGTMANSESVLVDAALFALDEVNHAGGVLGRPVSPVVVDGRSDWPTFAREAERLISQEQVCTVFGCWTSASRKTVKPVFETHNHLLIYPVQYEGLETSPCIVYMGASPNQQILPALDWALTALHKQRFFLVGSDYVFPRSAHAIIKDQLARAGAKLLGEAYLPLGSQSVEAAVSAIAQAKPDMILNTINGDSNTAFFRALRAAGIKATDTPTLSFSVGEQELRSLQRAAVEGDYAAWTYFQAIGTPENKEFLARYHARHPRQSVTDPMETAYIAVKLWALAVDEAQSIDPKKIRRALLHQRLTGPDGEVWLDPDSQHCFRTPRIGQIQADGQFKVVWTAPQPVRPDPYPDTRTAESWQVFLRDLYTGWGNRWSAPGWPQ